MSEGGGRHPIIGGVLLAGALGLLVYLGVTATRTQTAEREVKEAIVRAIEAGRDGEIEKAEFLLGDIVRKHPKNTDALFNYGVALVGLNKLDAADAVFVRILALDDKDYEALAERAGIAAEQDRIVEAFDFADNIPKGEGGLSDRLLNDGRWADLQDHPRMLALKRKHALGNTASK